MQQSYDPTTHFETTVQDVLAMYTRITGKVSMVSKFMKLVWSRNIEQFLRVMSCLYTA